MIKVNYTKYRFNKPNLISKSEYDYYKNELNNNKKFKLDFPSNFWEDFKIYIFYYCAVILIILITLIFDKEFESTFAGFVIFFIVLGVISLTSFLPSAMSYLDYITDRNNYFSNLFHHITISNNYDDFLKKYNIPK